MMERASERMFKENPDMQCFPGNALNLASCSKGCIFPNDVMAKQQTWNDILAAMMVAVRDTHGWRE